MSEPLVLQIANTRFAVKCDHPGFSQWLTEHFSGFLSQEEPRSWVNLILEDAVGGENANVGLAGDLSRCLTVTAIRDGDCSYDLVLCAEGPAPTDLFGLGLQLGLRLSISAQHSLDLLLHAAGVARGGVAYLFVGPSGAGKSTVCRLSAGHGDCFVLHDDMVALSQTDEGFLAWSTPLGGEMPASRSVRMPLGAIFFLAQDDSNYVTRLKGWQAVNLLVPQMLPPVSCRNGDIQIDHADSLKVLLALVGAVPCYELHFRRDPSFWDCIERLPSNECAATAVAKGAR